MEAQLSGAAFQQTEYTERLLAACLTFIINQPFERLRIGVVSVNLQRFADGGLSAGAIIFKHCDAAK